jgi:glycosyltransferase involved in cell wall biosynthesis
MHKSFIMILNSRYPTEKAYGVTTSMTAQAMNAQGYLVEIWAPSDDANHGLPYFTKNLVSKRNRVIIQFVNSFSERIGFKLQYLICLRLAVKSSRGLQGIAVYWVRDPYLALGLLCLTRKIPIIFEMHFPIKGLVKKTLIYGLKRKRVLIGTLTEMHRQSLELGANLSGTFILPMAAPDEFFSIGRKRSLEISKVPVVGYIGKATSSGHENGLTSFLTSVRVAQDRDLQVHFWLAGIEEHQRLLLWQLATRLGIREDFLQISGHINHELVPGLLSQFDFGLMPYGESSYNSYRFPIKSVEYAAANLPILATDTVSHHQILDSSIALFYDQSNPLDFVLKLEELLKNPNQILVLREAAKAWATNYTYHNRVKLASEALQNLGKMV